MSNLLASEPVDLRGLAKFGAAKVIREAGQEAVELAQRVDVLLKQVGELARQVADREATIQRAAEPFVNAADGEALTALSFVRGVDIAHAMSLQGVSGAEIPAGGHALLGDLVDARVGLYLPRVLEMIGEPV